MLGTFVRRRDSDYDVVLVRTHGCSMAARNLSSRAPFRSASVARERLFEDRQGREPVSQIVVSWRKVRVDPDRFRDQSNPSFPFGRIAAVDGSSLRVRCPTSFDGADVPSLHQRYHNARAELGNFAKRDWRGRRP